MVEASVMKRSRGHIQKSKEYQIVLTVFSYIKLRNPKQNVIWVANETLVATGTSRASVVKT